MARQSVVVDRLSAYFVELAIKTGGRTSDVSRLVRLLWQQRHGTGRCSSRLPAPHAGPQRAVGVALVVLTIASRLEALLHCWANIVQHKHDTGRNILKEGTHHVWML